MALTFEQKLSKVTKDQINAELCKRSLSFFIKEFWDEVVPNELIWSFHMDVISNEVQEVYERVFKREKKEYNLLTNIPPGMSKTMIVSVMSNAWAFARKPSIRVAVGSYSDAAITSIADNIRVVMRSVKYKKYFPNVEIRKDRNNLHNFKTASNGEFYAFTIGGTITSKHFDIIGVDDPVDPKRAASKAELLTTNNFMSQTLPSRCTDKEMTPILLTMQRLNQDDPSAKMLESGIAVRHICLPAEIDNTINPPILEQKYIDGLLDPIRLNRQVLEDFKIALGSYGYAGQFMQRPAPVDGGMLKKAYFKIIDPEHAPKATKQFMIDPAYTAEEKNDPSAILTYSYVGSNLYIYSCVAVRKEFNELCAFIKTHVVDQGYTNASLIRCEPKASGKSIVQSLKASTALNIRESKNPTKDKEARVNDILASVESGRVYLVKGGWIDGFLDECAVFPNGKHDDQVDCLVMACTEHFMKKGLKFY